MAGKDGPWEWKGGWASKSAVYVVDHTLSMFNLAPSPYMAHCDSVSHPYCTLPGVRFKWVGGKGESDNSTSDLHLHSTYGKHSQSRVVGGWG